MEIKTCFTAALAFVLLASLGLSQTTTTYRFFEGNETSVNYTFPAFGGGVSDNYTKVVWNTLQSNDRMTLKPYQAFAEDEIGYYRSPNGTFENYAIGAHLNDSFWYTNGTIGDWDGSVVNVSGNRVFEMISRPGNAITRLKTLAPWTLASDYVCFDEREGDSLGFVHHIYFSVYNSSDTLLAQYVYDSIGSHPYDISMRRCLNVSNHTGESIYFDFLVKTPNVGGGKFYLDNLSESNMSWQYPSDAQIETTHGYTIYSGSGELNSTVQVPNFYSAINQELLLCPEDETCDIYFSATSTTAGILEMSNLTFVETPIERNETQFNASEVAYDFTDCSLDTGVYYSYGSQSNNWSCYTLANVPHNFSALPTSQGAGSVDITNPSTFPMMYVIPQSGYQNFNLTFTVAADEGYYYGGMGQPLMSNYRNYGSLKILGMDTSHSGSYRSYWDVNIIPAGQDGSSQALKFTVRWYYANETLKQVSKSYPGENAIICPGCAGGGAVPQWINVRLVRVNSDYYVYYKHHYENDSAWTLVASFLGSENAPLYSFERVGASNFNTDVGTYSTYLDNITGDFASYYTGGGTNDAYGYVRIDDGDGVMDSGDHMIEGAKVTLYSGEAAIAVDYTDADGYFEFNDLVDGYYMASVDVVQDPDGEYDTNFHEAFDINIQTGKAFDETTTLSDGHGYWRSIGGNVLLMLKTIETGVLKAKATTDGATVLPGVVITNSYYNGVSYTVNDGYCTTNSTGECLLYLYSAYSAPFTQLYTAFASSGSTTKSQIVGISKNTLTNALFVMNYTQRYYIVPAEADRVGDFGEVTIDPSVIIINQYINDVYFKIWDVVENRYYSEAVDGDVVSYDIKIDSVSFYLQKEGGAFCLSYVQYPSVETCYIHYRHTGVSPYAFNISVVLHGGEIAEANFIEYPSYSVMREGRKQMTAYNASHMNISVEMLDDFTKSTMVDLNATNFLCKWNGNNMGLWGTYSSILVASTANSVSGTLLCTADNYSVFDKTTTFYLGDNTLESVDCTINNGKVFPPSSGVAVKCSVQSALFCSQPSLKNGMAMKINRAAQGTYASWLGMTLAGDDPDSDSQICNGGTCCNPRILFTAANVIFRGQYSPSPDQWEFLPEGTHYMNVLVNDTSATIAPYSSEFLFTLDKAAPTSAPQLISVDIPDDQVGSEENFSCITSFTNPQSQIGSLIITITKIANEADLESPENTVITMPVQKWYLDSLPIQDIYKFTASFSPTSCDDTTYTCTYTSTTQGYELTFPIKDGQRILCRAEMTLNGANTPEPTMEDSAKFIYAGISIGDSINGFASGLISDPYAFMLLIIAAVVLMPIIMMFLSYFLKGAG
jgi:hypothetical protein